MVSHASDDVLFAFNVWCMGSTPDMEDVLDISNFGTTYNFYGSIGILLLRPKGLP